jgi:cysteine desulfurase
MSKHEQNAHDGVYLDHAATSPLRPEVWRAMEAALGDADYNPASNHAAGRRAQSILEEARRAIARCIDAERTEICFTSGGTQANNLAVLGFVRARAGRAPRVFVSTVEHKAVLNAAGCASREGAEVRKIPVDETGTIDLQALEEGLAEDSARPTLVSLMWANNEIGTVQPVADALELARRYGATVHTDAVQALGKLDLSVRGVPVDMLTITAHKVGGPVGIGALFRRPDTELEPITFGGSQEQSLWPGTQNVLSAVGFATAARLATDQRAKHARAWTELRERLADRLRTQLDGLEVHGEGARERMPNLLSVSIPSANQTAVLLGLDLERVAVSAGSACSSGSSAPSHVLAAIGGSGGSDRAVLRFSFGPDTTPACVDRAADVLVRTVQRLQ